MPECSKRQREVNLGVEQHRCINREAETFRELVVIEQCDVCPVKKLLPQKKPCNVQPCKSCGQSATLDLYREGWPPCVYRQFQGEQAVCQVTGLPVDHDICNRCDETAREKTAGWGDKFVTYPAAIRKWVASGCPVRTEEEVQEIFETHCSKCDRFDKGNQACLACGCSISLGGNPLTNKLKMATEECPLGRFAARQSSQQKVAAL